MSQAAHVPSKRPNVDAFAELLRPEPDLDWFQASGFYQTRRWRTHETNKKEESPIEVSHLWGLQSEISIYQLTEQKAPYGRKTHIPWEIYSPTKARNPRWYQGSAPTRSTNEEAQLKTDIETASSRPHPKTYLINSKIIVIEYQNQMLILVLLASTNMRISRRCGFYGYLIQLLVFDH